MRKIAVFLVLLLLSIPHAQAATVDAQGAAHLRQLVEEELHWRGALAKLSGQGLVTAGAVSVTPQQDFYKITITGLSLLLGPDRALAIGTAAVHAVPGPDDTWEAEISLPADMNLTDQSDKPVAKMQIGTQHLTTSWVPAQGIYPRMNALYQDIRIKNLTPGGMNSSIKALHILSTLSANADHTWSGPGGFTADDITIDSATDQAQTKIHIGQAALASFYDRADLGKMADNRRHLLDMATGTSVAAPDRQKLLADMQNIVDTVSSSLGLRNVSIEVKPLVKTQQPVSASLDNLSLQGRLEHVQSDKATADVLAFAQGFRLSPLPAPLAGMMPHTANIEAHLQNLPLGKISALTFGAPAGTTAAALLQQSGSSMIVRDSFLQSPDLTLYIDGHVDATTQAALGVTGQAHLAATGLQNVIRNLQTLAAAPNADPQLSTYAGAMTAIMLMSRSGATPAGAAADVYDFELTPDGRLLMNGANLMTLVTAGAVLNDHVNHANPLIQKTFPQP